MGQAIAVLVLCGVAAMLVTSGASWVAALPFLALAGVTVAGARDRRSPRVANLLGGALRDLGAGALDDAERAIARAAELDPNRAQAMTIAYLRAEIAIERGDPTSAVSFATESLAIEPGPRSGDDEHLRAAALACRALACVGTGALDDATHDAAASEAIVEADVQSLGRARLVKALVLVRRGALDEARESLEKSEPLFATLGRLEQSLARALDRTIRLRKTSVYRQPNERVDVDRPPGAAATWVAIFFADGATLVEPDPPPSRKDEEPIAAPKRARVPAAPNKFHTAALWFFLATLLLAVAEWMHAKDPDAPSASFVAALSWSVSGVCALAVALRVWSWIFGERQRKRLAHARRRLIFGDRTELEELARGSGVAAATANLSLAHLASHKGDFEEALARCRVGIRHAGAGTGELAALYTEAAVAEAALGREAEARALLRRLERRVPGYFYLAVSTTRVELVVAARAGDFAAGATVARRRTSGSTLPPREELLADLVIAATTNEEDGRRARLRSDLGDHKAARWIDAVAPGLRETIKADAETRARIASIPDDEADSVEDDAAVATVGERARSAKLVPP